MIDAQQKAVKTTLRNFLRAFKNCDLTALERFFAPDSASFDQVIASSAGQAVSDFTPYRQCAGMPPMMRRLALELPREIRGPPYHSLVAQDLLIQMLGDAAVATFHIEREGIAATDSRVRERGQRLENRSSACIERASEWMNLKLFSHFVSETAISSMNQ